MVPSAPSTPTLVAPSNGGTALFTLLDWSSQDGVQYDVFLGLTAGSLVQVAIRIVDSFFVPTLLPNTTYFWKVTAVNAGGSVTTATWSFTTPAADALLCTIGGVQQGMCIDSVSIDDVLNDIPNTASVTFNTVQTAGQSVLIGRGTLDFASLIFAGEIQNQGRTYIDETTLGRKYPVDLIDRTYVLNKRRPFGTWVNTSATVIAQYIVSVFAPNFTFVNVQPNLPAISITFDGQDDFMSCVRRIANAITGYCYVDYADDLNLFITQQGVQPDPIDATHGALNDKPLRYSVDISQVRTRVFGKGFGTTILADVGYGETQLPLPDIATFNALGGKVIVGTTPGGASSTVLTYSGTRAGGLGSLVGPGAAPSGAPVAVLAVGTGIESGSHQYGFSDVTAAGESIVSPLATITVGLVDPPANTPTVGTVSSGGALDAGSHDYELTFVTATGETTPSPVSGVAVPLTYPGPTSAPTIAIGAAFPAGQSATPVSMLFRYTYVYSDGTESLPGPVSNTINTDGFHGWDYSMPTTQPTDVVTRHVYQSRDAGTSYAAWRQVAFTDPSSFSNTDIFQGGYQQHFYIPPGTVPAGFPALTVPTKQTVPLSNLQVSTSSVVTSRKLYRRFNGAGTFKLVTSLATTGTTYSDTTANSGLGAAAPSSNTATANQVALSSISTGVAAVTARKVYRTPVGSSQLKLLATLADNTTTVYTDSTPDASLGANAPVGDTSGLTQPSGQVNAGSVTLPTASASQLQPSGWVTLSGGQIIRYTGISGNTLTGIPASGSGSIVSTVIYGSQVIQTAVLTNINNSNGLPFSLLKGSSVTIFVQVDDVNAQMALGQLELDRNGNPTDGIREDTFVDNRMGEDLLRATVTALLGQMSRPIVTVTYDCHDIKSRSGKTVHVEALEIVGDYVIQRVAITVDETILRFSVQASSVRFTFNDLLGRVALR